jgi:serine/threonine protein kinase
MALYPSRASFALTPDLVENLDRSFITLGVQLGSGFFGVVHRGTLAPPGMAAMAVVVKVLKDDADDAEKQAFRKEIDSLLRMRHVNLVACLGACTSSAPVMMVMELCTEGSLDSLLKDGDTRLDIKVPGGAWMEWRG